MSRAGLGKFEFSLRRLCGEVKEAIRNIGLGFRKAIWAVSYF